VGEVAEAEGGAAEVLESAVDRLGGSVGGAGSVEEREHVRGAPLQRPAELAQFLQGRRDTGADRVDHGSHHLLPGLLVGVPVRGDDPLVDAPGRFHLDVLVDREQRGQPCPLRVGEEVVAGVQSPTRHVERIPGTAPMAERGLLHALPGALQRVTGQPDDVERVQHRHRVGDLLGRGGLEAGESVHRDDVDPVPPPLRTAPQPLLERVLRPALDHVQQPRRAGPVAGRSEVDDHRHIPVATPGVPPHVLIDPHPVVTPSNRAGSSISTRCPSARTAVFAVCHATPRPAATRLTDKWLRTMPSSAHRSPPREIFARGSAAAVVSCRHSRPHPAHR